MKCPNCDYLQFCPCSSCKNKISKDFKPWIWVDEQIRCANCGLTKHIDWWELKENYSLKNK